MGPMPTIAATGFDRGVDHEPQKVMRRPGSARRSRTASAMFLADRPRLAFNHLVRSAGARCARDLERRAAAVRGPPMCHPRLRLFSRNVRCRAGPRPRVVARGDSVGLGGVSSSSEANRRTRRSPLSTTTSRYPSSMVVTGTDPGVHDVGSIAGVVDPLDPLAAARTAQLDLLRKHRHLSSSSSAKTVLL